MNSYFWKITKSRESLLEADGRRRSSRCLLFNALYYLCHIDHEIVGSIQSSCYTCGVHLGLTLAISPTPQEKYWVCDQPVSWIL